MRAGLVPARAGILAIPDGSFRDTRDPLHPHHSPLIPPPSHGTHTGNGGAFSGRALATTFHVHSLPLSADSGAKSPSCFLGHY